MFCVCLSWDLVCTWWWLRCTLGGWMVFMGLPGVPASGMPWSPGKFLLGVLACFCTEYCCEFVVWGSFINYMPLLLVGFTFKYYVFACLGFCAAWGSCRSCRLIWWVIPNPGTTIDLHSLQIPLGLDNPLWVVSSWAQTFQCGLFAGRTPNAALNSLIPWLMRMSRLDPFRINSMLPLLDVSLYACKSNENIVSLLVADLADG